MKWKDISFEEKCSLLGEKGEKFVYSKLLKKYPKDNYIILDLHSFCEMDWVVIDKNKEEIIEIYEVKTTTKDKKEFSAGSHLQLLVFQLQKIKKQIRKEFIPSFLYVLRANNKFWDDGELDVIKEEIYNIDEIEIDLKNCMWKVK